MKKEKNFSKNLFIPTAENIQASTTPEPGAASRSTEKTTTAAPIVKHTGTPTESFITRRKTRRIKEVRSEQIPFRLTADLKQRMEKAQKKIRGVRSINELVNRAIKSGLNDPELIPEEDLDNDRKTERIRILITSGTKNEINEYMKTAAAFDRTEFITAAIQSYLSKEGQ